MTAAVARVYAGATAICVGFAIWVSLVPFDHRPATLDDAAHMLWVLGSPGTVRFSLTDAISNLLLFMPIGLLGAATLERTRARRGQAALVLASGMLLSVVVEFCQAFVTWRTPSTLDVMAECTGTALGLVLWRLFHAEVEAAATAAVAAWRRATISERLSLIYAAAFALAWLFPFDFTLAPADVGDKYLHKRLLPPFSPSPDAATPVELALVLAAAIPLAWAGAICGRPAGASRPPTRTVVVAMLGLTALTIVQVAVFSRTTDFTLLVAALPGVTIGAVLAQGWRSRPRLAPTGRKYDG